ncbi:zinc ribbon domain-containing protein [Paenibacillus lemnae]|uniref:Nucleic acid-binding protein n=1 Tax=Paenibacillus lemnae TaxID=1330551 RepID=A0A848MAY5_PAELE|nr:zinc ribbon domain-containing protein [Paenibacillus lemnae]NMO97696.1 hypothetical protein [Paenibacillus lemnae]
MIECPWCSSKVELFENVCPECKHEVLIDREGNVIFETQEDFEGTQPGEEYTDVDISEIIIQKFKCSKCGQRECDVNEVAMTGTGLSKILDIQYNHYLFVTCEFCGYVEVYNPDVLLRKKSGSVSTVLDILFGN